MPSDDGDATLQSDGSVKLVQLEEHEVRRVEPLVNLASLGSQCADVQAADEIRKQANVTRALLHAEEDLLSSVQEPPETLINDDWLYRWRDHASQVSTDELQDLWGRLLAGEVKAPGRYSLRTLEFLRNLSAAEAAAIERLSQFSLGGAIFRDAKGIFEAEGIDLGFLLEMQQLGIIAGVEAKGLEMTYGSAAPSAFSLPIKSNGMALIVSGSDANAQFSIPAYQVTSIGSQVMSLGKFNANVPYLRSLGEHIRRQGLDVKLAKFIDIGPNEIRCFDWVPL